MNLGQIISLMEKVGSIKKFDSPYERQTFLKIAQGAMPPMDPAMMQQMAAQGGMPPMQDPSMMAAAGGMPPMQDPSMMGMGAPGGMPPAPAPEMPTAGSEESIIGESIQNSDIESLLKIMNVVSSLKGRYDAMKKEQLDMLKAQSGGGEGEGPSPMG